MVGLWWGGASEEVRNRTCANYSTLLKNELSTKNYKELTFNEFEEALEISTNKAIEGKVIMRPL